MNDYFGHLIALNLVCVYVYVYVCMYVCMYVCVLACVGVFVFECTQTHSHTWNFEFYQLLLVTLRKDLLHLNHTMTSLTDKGMEILLQKECQSGENYEHTNPCLIQCHGQVASKLKYFFCVWSTDIKPELTSLLVNMDVLLKEQVRYLKTFPQV